MNNTYLIGEIGQNHNGSPDLARLLIELASREVRDELFCLERKPLNAVKLTKRDLKEELSDSAMNKSYTSPHSFGDTYGEHREFLELNDEQHHELYIFSKEKGLDFVETLCSRGCLSLLKLFTPDKLKVASRDLTNLPLLEEMAETEIPIILSTGMGGKAEIDNALEVITKHHENISILHCLSEYPSSYKNINLKTIDYLKKNYPNYQIGYSDHSIGISIPLAAVAMGATIVEKHITIDRSLKGTDQKGSLGPDGLNRMIRDIRNLEDSLGEESIYISDSVQSAKIKLERSIASVRGITKGEIIQKEDLHMLSPGDGFRWSENTTIIGKKAMEDIPANEIIYSNMIS